MSFEEDFFERLMFAFVADPMLGIAGGTCYEQSPEGNWEAHYATRDHVRSARRVRIDVVASWTSCLSRPAWGGTGSVDELKAQVAGWRTATLPDLPFLHHRQEGERDGSRARVWAAEGEAAYYMRYRFSYMCLRAAYPARRDPSAMRMIGAYWQAALKRGPRWQDERAVRYLRDRQRIRGDSREGGTRRWVSPRGRRASPESELARMGRLPSEEPHAGRIHWEWGCA